jgi:hypothetical protein
LAKRASSDDGNILGVETYVQIPGVCGWSVGLEYRPRPLAVRSVDIQLRVATSSGDDSPVGASDGGPDVSRRAGRLVSGGCLQGYAGNASKSQGVAANLVVDGELVAAETGSAAVLVSQHVLSVADLSYDRHSGSSGVDGVGDVVDDGAPCLAAIGRYLMNHLLAIPRVSLRRGESRVGATQRETARFPAYLVAVVAHELVVVHHKERLPDGGFTVVGFLTANESHCDVPLTSRLVNTYGNTPIGDMRDECPSKSAIDHMLMKPSKSRPSSPAP